MSEDKTALDFETDRWQRQWKIFDRALELEGAARRSLLDELCEGDAELRREVESLLAAHAGQHSRIERPLVDLRGAFFADEDAGRDPEIDRYELLDPLGTGGMGQVYAARRTDGLHDQVVAIKVLKRGLDTDLLIRRFATERRILARLSHPHIARLLDGGSTHDGRPYLVMERVRGTPIDTYVDEHKLSVQGRLELFQRVCRAVHFAHQNLVVHRDLKPSNILISEDGFPRLLDFGIAKLLAGDEGERAITEPGSAPMTPQYASPEQLAGHPATTAGDVYSLGLLLFQLLAGRPPYRLGPGPDLSAQWKKVRMLAPSRLIETESDGAGLERLAEQRNTTPAKLCQALQGDLDNVVLKALAERPEDRYLSAEALAEDLDRFMAGLPVRARPSTVTYRARKFVQRHSLAVAASAVVFVALLVLVSLLWVQSHRLRTERDHVVMERNRATVVSDFLVELFTSPDPTRIQGETVTARRLLERGVERIETELASEDAVRAALLTTMGRSLAGLGLYEEAKALLREALELRRQEGGDPEAVAEGCLRLAEVLAITGPYGDAAPLLQEALEIRQAAFEPDDRRLAEVWFQLGDLAFKQGHFQLADSQFLRAADLARSAQDDLLLAKILDRRAGLLQQLGDLDDAQRLFDEAVAAHRRTESRAWLALSLNNSALLLTQREEFDRADELFREAEQRQRELFDSDHPQLATTVANRGLLEYNRGELKQAEALLSQALESFRHSLGASHPKVASTLNNLGSVETRRGRFDQAESHYREALAIEEETLGVEHASTANTLNNLARMLSQAGRSAELEPLFQQALKVTSRQLGDDHPRVGAMLTNLGEIIREHGELDRAESLFIRAVDILRQEAAEGAQLAKALSNLSNLQQQRGDVDGALKTGREAVSVMAQALGDSHPDLAMLRTRLASVLVQAEDCPAARRQADQALEIFREKSPDLKVWIEAAEDVQQRCASETGSVPP